MAAVGQATAIRRLGPRAHRFSSFVTTGLRDPLTLAVVAAYLTGFALHAVAIWLLPLYLAQGTIAFSMPVTAVTARLLLGEPLGARSWTAIGAITLGIVLLGLGAGTAGDPVASWGFVLLVWVGLLVALLVGLGAWRARRSMLLGSAAGIGYAGSAVAVRGVAADLSPQVLASALVVPLLGLVAFWLYSLAMSLAEVTPATSALIVAQTFLPAGVGLALLGDGVRDGWFLAVVAGLVLAVGGSIALARGSGGVRVPQAS